MISENEILIELKKINRHLEKQNSSIKNVGRAFSAGMFNALGSLFGTAIVVATTYGGGHPTAGALIPLPLNKAKNFFRHYLSALLQAGTYIGV